MGLADAALRTSIWSQFGAAVDFLDDSIRACPDNLWTTQLWPTPDAPHAFSQFWYVAYHTLFWLDCYLTGTEEGFLPPSQFLLIEQYQWGPMPERIYGKEELLEYLDVCRQRCKTTIDALTDERAREMCYFGWGECTFLELLLYTMRHVQGHAAEMSLLLGNRVGPQNAWNAQTAN